ncbi:MAG: hypothetical protein KDA24_15495 [Deltaproteobacteria bacterium]|nr:hypothetical protein [Deltaproteobacteria bacterium]
MRASWLLLLSLFLAAPAVGQDSYIMGEEEETEDLGPELARFTKLRDHRYSERFAVERVTLAANGAELAAITRASREGAKSWDLGSGRSMKLPPMSRDAATLAWSPAQDLLAVTVKADVLSGAQAGIELLRMSDGGSAGFLIGGETAKTLAFSPDGGQLAAASGEGVLLFSLPGGKGRLILDQGSGADTVAWLSPSQLMVASDGGARIVRIDVDGKVLESWEGKRADGGICFSPTGRFVALGQEAEFRVIDLWNGGPPQRVLLEGAVTSLAWSLNGKTLVAGTDIGLVHVFAVEGAPGVAFSKDPAPASRGGRTARAQGNDRDDSQATRGSQDSGRIEASTSSSRSRDDGLITLRGDERSSDDRGSMEAGSSGVSAADLEPVIKVLVLDSMSSDPRDGRSMEASVKKSIKRLEPCWKRQARAGKLGRGKMVLELGVNANGEGVAIQAPLEDTFTNEKLLSCLDERLRETLFGSGLGSMDIELTIELQ